MAIAAVARPNVRRPSQLPAAEVGDASGQRNQNPEGIGLFALLAEDLRTHDSNPLEPGFLAIALHRLGNKRMDIRYRLLRAPLSLAYRTAHTAMVCVLGIDLGYTVKVGRRVRLWHQGGMILGARRIGDDVHIRHHVTMGIAHRGRPWEKPVIEDGVDIGSGAAILGDVVVGKDSLVGANSVVVRSFPPNSTLFGVPARAIAGTSLPLRHVSPRES